MLLATICIAFTLTTLTPTPTHAATWYVDAAAEPYGAGNIPEPFSTITAAAQVVDEGDTILIREGVYTERVTIERNDVTLAAWGAALPELRSNDGPAITVRANDCRIMRLRFTGSAGVELVGVANYLRGCNFDRCARPIKAEGRAHTVLFCTVRNSAFKGDGALFEIAGPGSYIGGNRFIDNAAIDAAAISLRGRGCVARNNILFSSGDAALRYGIVSASGPEDHQFDSCINQQIVRNRLHSGVREAFIHVEGERHDGSLVARNTIVGAAEAVRISAEGISVSSNLVGRTDGYASVDPEDPAFLWLAAVAPVDPTDAPKPYAGARPAWPGLASRDRAKLRHNLALGRDYLYFGPPSHGDRDLHPSCLADGYAPKKMWGHQDGTDFAGWHMNGMDNRLYVRFDLGRPCDIDAVRVYAPHQHVWRAGMPLQVDVSVSNDDRRFRYAGSVLSDLPQPPGNYWNEVEGLDARGRYVLLTVYTDWSYSGLGEFEILGTVTTDDRPPRLSGPVPRTLDEILGEGPDQSRFRLSDVGAAYMGRYRKNVTELAAVERKAQELGVRAQVDELVNRAARAVEYESSPDSRINPDVARALRGLSTAVLTAAYGQSDLILSAGTPYDEFSGSHIPDRRDVGIEEVSIMTCGDEREPGAFFVTNPMDEDLELRIEVEPLRTKQGDAFPLEQIVLRSPVDFVIGDPDRKVKGDFFHDKNNAVVRLDHGEGNRLPLMRLETRLVWIIADTTDVASGTYHGAMTLSADGIDPVQLRLVITVHPVRIPEQLDLHAYMWSYWRAGRIRDFRAEAFRDAIRHKANTILDHGIPHPVSLGEDGVDEQGHLLKPLNFDHIDWQIDQWNKSFRDPSSRVKFYVFWLAFGNEGYGELQMGIPVGSPRWNTLVVEWLNAIAAHLHERHGLTTDQFALYLKDELEARQVVKYYEPMSDALKAADPEKYPHARHVKLFVNPMTGTVMSSSWQHFEQRYDKLGLLAPLAGDYPDRILESLHRSGNLVWSHSTAGKSAGYGAKLSGWRCMQKGFDGMGFFIYVYSRYPSGLDRVYTKKDKVPGAGDETIVPTRGWEAWRDGQEDWYLLSRLKKSAHEAREADPGGFARAMRVFHGTIDSVFAAPDDPRASIAARERVIAEILRLEGGG